MSDNRLVRRSARQLPAKTVIFVIELYRTWISPMRLPSCRFYPTCSAYAVEALEEWGFIRGGWLSIVRLIKCGPWHKPGYDPIPERHRTSSKVSACPSSDSSGELDDHHSVRL